MDLLCPLPLIPAVALNDPYLPRSSNFSCNFLLNEISIYFIVTTANHLVVTTANHHEFCQYQSFAIAHVKSYTWIIILPSQSKFMLYFVQCATKLVPLL